MQVVAIIVGLCGSGKSHLANEMEQEGFEKFDEGVVPGLPKFAPFTSALLAGKNCVVVDIAYSQPKNRAGLCNYIRERQPGAHVEWIFFENHPGKANLNCERDPNPDRPRADNIVMNADLSRSYDIPEDATVLPVHVIGESPAPTDAFLALAGGVGNERGLFVIAPGPRPRFASIAAHLWGAATDFDSDGNSADPDDTSWTELTVERRPDYDERLDVDPVSENPLVLKVRSSSTALVVRAAGYLARYCNGTLVRQWPPV